MAKRLLFLYTILNAFIYFAVSISLPTVEADRLAELLSQRVDCLKGQERTLITIMLESHIEKAQRVALIAPIPWLFLAAAIVVHSCWRRVMRGRGPEPSAPSMTAPS
ncbi:MAG: hypothetical protein ACPL7J_13250 [Desulfomonilaceae bacterium]